MNWLTRRAAFAAHPFSATGDDAQGRRERERSERTIVQESDEEGHGVHAEHGVVEQLDERREAAHVPEHLHVLLVGRQVDEHLQHRGRFGMVSS